jgi:hypothetical protein
MGTDELAYIVSNDALVAALVDVRAGTRAEIPEDQREEFRRALKAFVERIEVGATTRRGGAIDLDRVVITPRRALHPAA